MGMFLRIFYIQVLQKDHYAKLSTKQSLRRSIVSPERGVIYDRNQNPLVVNAVVDLEFEEQKKTKKRKLQRVAPNGSLAGQVLGNVGYDGHGQMGLEADQDRILRGIDGWRYARVDAKRRYHPGFETIQEHPINGADIVTTLDVDIQKAAEQALARGVKRTKALDGLAVVIEPNTGDVLAMAVYPFYNPNRRSKQDLKGWKNQVISKVYEPGSTFKVITAAAVMEERKTFPEEVFFAENGAYYLRGAHIKDTKEQGFVTMKEAMAYSSNIVMVKAGMRLSPNLFYRYVRSFGFGMRTGVSLPAEEKGFLKPVSTWNTRTQLTMSWGQELGATPLQMVMAMGAVANGGLLMKPRLILEEYSEEQEKRVATQPIAIRRVISEETSDKIRKMLVDVVEYGTARRIKTDHYEIAGKTGTAEKIDKETGKYVSGKFHSSFIGMVPADRPKYVALVLVNEPQLHKHGGSSAAPIFKEMMDRILVSKMALQDVKKENQVQQVHLASFSPNLLDLSNNEHKKKAALSIENHKDKSYVMPNVKGLSLRDALLRMQHLQHLNLSMEYQGVGKIVKQNPKPGTPLSSQSKTLLQLEVFPTVKKRSDIL
jgi:cell division protein FtsI/penicillin-binding protein 2